MAKVAAEVFRRGDENTLVGVAVDGKSFRQNGRTADVRMELGGNRAGGLTSHDHLKLGNKSLEVYQILVQHIARDNSGLSLARKKNATCFLRWIMPVMTDSTIQMRHQRAMRSKIMEKRISTVILNVYQSTGIENEDGSRLCQ